ncbi:hypothetical protein [Anaeromicropila populeti]|uniref:Uncharacterized protein n=1 Tax=Anaeromicropila populeti TaxID=37658 RepID=A0A1I6KKZ8_9FIRM|nr:hypothetical protein [Anaeromicropila populeti]SFR91560.1 hypothetical protein SAMN05661086_02480 [Anaeromicropila populeti]
MKKYITTFFEKDWSRDDKILWTISVAGLCILTGLILSIMKNGIFICSHNGNNNGNNNGNHDRSLERKKIAGKRKHVVRN